MWQQKQSNYLSKSTYGHITCDSPHFVKLSCIQQINLKQVDIIILISKNQALYML